MNLCWKYENGNWTPIEDPFGECSGDESWSDCLQRAGYKRHPFLSFGTDDYGNGVSVYKKQDEEPPLYLSVMLCSDEVMTVLVDDMANLMQWLKDYWPPLALENMHVTHTEMLEALRKAFQAWHGHEADDICSECDPFAWERRCQRRAERDRQRQQTKPE